MAKEGARMVILIHLFSWIVDNGKQEHHQQRSHLIQKYTELFILTTAVLAHKHYDMAGWFSYNRFVATGGNRAFFMPLNAAVMIYGCDLHESRMSSSSCYTVIFIMRLHEISKEQHTVIAVCPFSFRWRCWSLTCLNRFRIYIYIYIYVCVCVCITGFESTKDLNIKWRIYLKTFFVEEHRPAYLTWSKSWLQKDCDATRQGISAHSMNLVISEYSDLFTSCAFYKHWLTLIRSWISNYIHYEGWAEITYPFLNSNGATVDV